MDSILTALRSLLVAALTEYTTVYYGENKIPAEADFPLLEIIPRETERVQRGTNSFNNTYTVTISIKDTLKSHVTANTDKSVSTHMQKMVQRMEERDADGEPKSTTVLGVLSDNLKISNTAHINGDWRVRYDQSPFNGSWILIASVTFTINKITTK